MISNLLPLTRTSGISGLELYSDAITAPYAPADLKANKSFFFDSAISRWIAKVSPVSQTGPTISNKEQEERSLVSEIGII